MGTYRTLFASTSVTVRTARDAVVIMTTDVVVHSRSLNEDRESSENSEGWEELHDDVE